MFSEGVRITRPLPPAPVDQCQATSYLNQVSRQLFIALMFIIYIDLLMSNLFVTHKSQS